MCEVAFGPGQNGRVLGSYVAVNGVRVDVLVAMAELADFETFVGLLGKAVEVAPLGAV